MSIPAEAQEAITKAGEDTTEFMQSFTAAYLQAFVKLKVDGLINDTVSKALPGAPGLSIDGGLVEDEEPPADDAGDDGAALEEKEDVEPVAAGVALVNFKLLTGPDKAPHRYYNLAGVSVKPKDSVITRITRTHRMLASQATQLLKEPGAPKVQFPKKKYGKKADAYYKARFQAMTEFYDALNASPVSISDSFLKFFELRFDPERAEHLEVFYAALEPVAEDKGIDLEGAMERAEEIGIETVESEMLKVLAIDIIAKPQSETVSQAIEQNVPGFLPQKVKNRVQKMGDTSLNTVVATAIDASWAALGATFEAVSKGIGSALDQGLGPIQAVLDKAADPIGNIVREKFKISDETPEPTTNQEIHLDRYPWLVELLDGVRSGKAVEALSGFEKKVGTFKNKQDWAGYLTYDFGPDWVADLQLPYISDVAEPHEHLVNSLLEAWIVLSSGGVKALKPLFQFHDSVCKNFDANTFQDGLRDAARQAGQQLATEYFALPRTLKKATKHLGTTTTKVVLNLAKKTIEGECDMIGQVARAWNPQNSGEVTPTFVEALAAAATTWGNVTAARFLTTVRTGTQLQFVRLAMEEIGGQIDEVSGSLDELVGALPDPIGSYLKPGELCKNMLDKFVFKAAYFGTLKIAKPTEDTFYNVGGVRQTILRTPTKDDEAAANAANAQPHVEDQEEAAIEAAEDAGYNTSDDEAGPEPGADDAVAAAGAAGGDDDGAATED